MPLTVSVPIGFGAGDRSAIAAGFLVGLANPLTVVFFLGIMPQALAGVAVTPAVAGICLAALAVTGAIAHAPYLAASGSLRRLLGTRLRGLGLASGCLMVALGAGAMMGLQ
jgi:threonine/homoserine/homoserine lactone efflux protein